MNNHFLNNGVVDNSKFFMPVDIGQLPDNGEHCITFLPNDDYGLLWSEPKKVKTSFGDKFTTILKELSNPKNQHIEQTAKINVEYLNELSQSISSRR